MNPFDTIAAIATAAGHGGIGIVRISGEQAVRVLRRMFRRKGSEGHCKPSKDSAFPNPRRVYHGHIIDPRSNAMIDEALAFYMAAPHSYTREDVVELQCHGGPAVLNAILDAVFNCGVRPAEPGEFTRRAFLNGRIDLSQAEAVADMIQARSRSAGLLAARQLDGVVGQTIRQWVALLNAVTAQIEAFIEFPEDTADLVDDLQRQAIVERIDKELVAPMNDLMATYAQGRVVRDGIRIAIVGRPNVGKSSLLNRLVAQERAIVTDTPGTTRDVIEVDCFFGGVATIISDCAGIRESQDPVEQIGVERAQACADNADLVLLVLAADEGCTAADRKLLQKYRDKRTLVVINKWDLVGEAHLVPFDVDATKGTHITLSARTGLGLAALKTAVQEIAEDLGSQAHCGATVCSLRHKRCLEEAVEHTQRALSALQDSFSEDMVSLDLQAAVRALQGITGESTDEAVLDAIFSRFCIGK